MPVRPGDHVVFPASAGAWVEVDEERLLVCRVDASCWACSSASRSRCATPAWATRSARADRGERRRWAPALPAKVSGWW